MAGGLSININGIDAFRNVSKALGDASTSIGDDIKKSIADEAEKLAQTARELIGEEPTHGAKQTGLRATIAEGVQVEVTSTGANITSEMPEADEESIPSGFDDGAVGWFHPVFGNRKVWVRQTGAFSWWSDTMAAGQDNLTNAIQQTLEDAADKIADSAT